MLADLAAHGSLEPSHSSRPSLAFPPHTTRALHEFFYRFLHPDLLFTEPIVAVFSLWVGFAWSFLFMLLESVALIFGNLYDFNSGSIGLVFLSLV
jgi:hypothetical protein